MNTRRFGFTWDTPVSVYASSATTASNGALSPAPLTALKASAGGVEPRVYLASCEQCLQVGVRDVLPWLLVWECMEGKWGRKGEDDERMMAPHKQEQRAWRQARAYIIQVKRKVGLAPFWNES